MANLAPVLRSPAIDAVRVIGMLAIVAGHVWWDDTARALLYTWHVPLFFFISGYLWKPGRSLRYEIRVRARTLLYPYALWFGLIALVAWSQQLVAGTFSLRGAELSMYGGSYTTTPFSAFWFVTTLFFTCVLYRIIDRLPLWSQWSLAVGALFVGVYLPGQPARLLPLGVGLALAALIFVVAGRTFREIEARGLLGRRPLIFALTSIAAGALLVVLGAKSLDMKLLVAGTPVVSIIAAILISAGLISSFGEVLARVGGRTSKVITLAAQASLVVLFVHIPVMYVFSPPGSAQFGAFVGTVVVSWGIGIALLMVPRAWPLTGALKTEAGGSRGVRA